MTELENYAYNVRAIRMERKLSMHRLAELAGVSMETINRIEGGFSPSFETAVMVAKALNVDMSKLLDSKMSCSLPITRGRRKRTANYTQLELVK